MPEGAKLSSRQLVDGHSAPRFKRGQVIDGRYQLQRRIGQGRYSDVYEAIKLQDEQKCAVKVDKEDADSIMLKWENQVLSIMQAHDDKDYFCKYINSGLLEDGSVYIAMELLGENLSEYRKRQTGHRFSKRKVADIIGHMLGCIEVFHSEGFIHRDLKPSNFGRLRRELCDSSRKNFSKLIDFGLARKWRSDAGKVLKPRAKAEFRGTTKYASLNAHAKKELSRRDDLFSLFFIAVHFLTGDLPWIQSDREEAAALKTQFMNDPKVLPLPMVEFLTHLQSLKFEDAPDYEFLKSCLQKLAHMDSPQPTPREAPEQALLPDNDITLNTPPYKKSSPMISSSGTPPPIVLPSSQPLPPFQKDVSPSISVHPPPTPPTPPPLRSSDIQQYPSFPHSPPQSSLPHSPPCTKPPRPCRRSSGSCSDRSRFPENRNLRQPGEDAVSEDRSSRQYGGHSSHRPSGDSDKRYYRSWSSERKSSLRNTDDLSLSEIWKLPVCLQPLQRGMCTIPRCTYLHPSVIRVRNNFVPLCFEFVRGRCLKKTHCPYYHWNEEEKAHYVRTGWLPEAHRYGLGTGQVVCPSRLVSAPSLREAFSASTQPSSSASRSSYNLPARPGNLLGKGSAVRIPKVGQEVVASETKLSADLGESTKEEEHIVSNIKPSGFLKPDKAFNRTENQAALPSDSVVSSPNPIPRAWSRALTSSAQTNSCALPLSPSGDNNALLTVESSFNASIRARKMRILSIQRSWSQRTKLLDASSSFKSGKTSIMEAIKLRKGVCKTFESKNESGVLPGSSKQARKCGTSEALRNTVLSVHKTWKSCFSSVAAAHNLTDMPSMPQRRCRT